MSIKFLHLLLLIIIANGAPIVARMLLNGRFNLAVDFGQKLPDKKQVFGDSKTWRGILAALLLTSVVAYLLGYSPVTGLLVAASAMLGDLFSSLIKRRLSLPPSSMAPFLDQVPESFLPALIMMQTFALDIYAVIALVLAFIILELGISAVLYKLGARKRPY